MGAHLLSEVGPVPGAISATYAATLGLALVYLGEHYAVDLLGGAVLTESIRAVAPRLTPLARRLAGALVQALYEAIVKFRESQPTAGGTR